MQERSSRSQPAGPSRHSPCLRTSRAVPPWRVLKRIKVTVHPALPLRVPETRELDPHPAAVVDASEGVHSTATSQKGELALTGGRGRLVRTAYRLKKAWLLSVGIVGVERLQPSVSAVELTVPDYGQWSRAELQNHVKALEGDLEEILRAGVQFSKGRKQLHQIARVLEDHYDQWQAAGGGLYTISTVHDFERRVGRLRSREHMETPVYGEMLLQGVIGLAIRHPEYMLVRDLGLFFDLHQDADRLLVGATRLSDVAWAGAAGENRQSLARAVILTCFNLLEAFANGLAREYLMRGDSIDGTIRRQLEDMQKPLRTRLPAVVRLVSGRACSLDVNLPPMSVLFGPIKEHRDAFVHCEPGPQLSAKGYSKETAFHNVSPSVVVEAVRNTFDVIRTAWRDAHQQDGPRWLPNWKGGRFGKQNLQLVRPARSADSGG